MSDHNKMNVHSFFRQRIMKTSDKREGILQATLELVSEQGFHGAPMADIAAKAGVAAGTIYRYFESRDALISELHKKLEQEIITFIQCGYPSARPIRERFLYITRSIFRYFMKHPLHFRYMEQYFNSPYGICLHRDRLLGKHGNHDILMDIFLQGTKQQVLKELPMAVLFSLAFGPMISLIRDHILGFCILDEALIRQVTEACWDAIKR